MASEHALLGMPSHLILAAAVVYNKAKILTWTHSFIQGVFGNFIYNCTEQHIAAKEERDNARYS